jgi:cytochrome c
MRLFKFTFILTLVAATASAEEIHVAAKVGDLESIQSLLAEGVPVDQASTRDASTIGASALLVAVKWGKREVAETLLEAGANPDFKPLDEGMTPLALAAQYGRAEILRMFLERGANPDGPAGSDPPMHFARQMKHLDIQEILIEFGASSSITQPPISHLLSGADVERGRRLARFCHVCHGDLELTDTGKNAPVLWNIVGRAKGSQPDAEYTEALQRAGGVWTFDELNSFLARPGGFVPGTAMWDIDTSSEQSRIDIIAYLRTLSDDPVPLP